MANEIEQKADIGRLFDRIARRYDRFNHLLSMGIDKGWRRRAVNGMQHHQNVLDVAVGTGDLALELLARNKADKVTGIDLSEEMMRVAEHKARRKGLGERLGLMKANAQAMPFEDASFDAVTCGFGIRNFQHLNQGLQEMYRVLKPGGELLILEFAYPDNRLVRGFYNLYFVHLMPIIGRMLVGDKKPFLYFRESVRGFMWGDKLVEQLRAAGFKDATYQPLSCSIAMIYKAIK